MVSLMDENPVAGEDDLIVGRWLVVVLSKVELCDTVDDGLVVGGSFVVVSLEEKVPPVVEGGLIVGG